MSTPNGPMAAFCVGSTQVNEAGIALDQRVAATMADHRGLVEMPAYAVMAESVTGGAYWYSFHESVATVQAWLALTAGAPVRVGDRLHAVSQLTHRDEQYGTAAVTVTNGSRDVVCTGVARAVRVGRTTVALQAIDKDNLSVPVEALAAPRDVDMTVAPIDAGWDGGKILSAISGGDISAGPLCQLLAMSVATDADDPELTVAPQPWMANPLGAIQGGVIAAIVGQACSVAGQAHTGPGDRYSVADLSVFYFRSPPVDGGPLTLETAAERVGRRLATVSAAMTDTAGTLYARAVANIAYDRATPA